MQKHCVALDRNETRKVYIHYTYYKIMSNLRGEQQKKVSPDKKKPALGIMGNVAFEQLSSDFKIHAMF